MSRAIDATSRDITSPPGTFGAIVRRGEVANLYCDHCIPPYTIRAIEFDEPPWGRFLDEPVGRFQCPACGKGPRHARPLRAWHAGNRTLRGSRTALEMQREPSADPRPDNWRGSLAANVEEVYQTINTATLFQGDCQCGNDDGNPSCKKGGPNRYPLDSSVPLGLARSEFAVS
jgi:hypothetical protein